MLLAWSAKIWFASPSARDRQERREFGGLGIEIAFQDGVLKVLYPIRNAPAGKAGVMAYDIITHIDDKATRGMALLDIASTWS